MNTNYVKSGIVKSIFVAFVGLFGTQLSAFASDYSPLVQRGSVGFNTKFAPTSDLLSIDNGDVNFASTVADTSLLKWRIFVPPGTKTLQMSMYTYASPPESKVLMRFGNPPQGSAANVTAENANLVPTTSVLQLLTAGGGGAELPFYSPASSGGVKLSSRSNEITQTILTTNGGWVYINAVQLPGGRIFELQTTVTVDETCYRSWFANAQWDAVGNPAEGVTHTCAGSTGGVTPPSVPTNPGTPTTPTNPGTPIVTVPLTFDPPTLFKDSTLPVTISGVPADAQCVAKSILTGGKSAYVTVDTNNTILAKHSVSSSLTSTQRIRIVCGNAAGDLDIVMTADSTTGGVIPPTPTIPTDPTTPTIPVVVPPSQVTETSDASGLTLGLKFVPAAADIGKSAKVWIGAKITIMGTSSWLFKVGSEWRSIASLDLGSYSFHDITSVAASNELTVPLGLPKATLNHYAIEIHSGYQTSTGAFNYLGKVWPQN